jgi:hypothetical protein
MTTDPNELTARESEVLALAWQCMDTDPKVCFFSTIYAHIEHALILLKINFQKLADLAGVCPTCHHLEHC